jgi:hypothetical protein
MFRRKQSYEDISMHSGQEFNLPEDLRVGEMCHVQKIKKIERVTCQPIQCFQSIIISNWRKEVKAPEGKAIGYQLVGGCGRVLFRPFQSARNKSTYISEVMARNDQIIQV